ncbi:MAG: hypothetical protein QM528_09115 [Phycisphaerales bacterium]|nr:hypothetical protein [Phycisphaerales bacterium]
MKKSLMNLGDRLMRNQLQNILGSGHGGGKGGGVCDSTCIQGSAANADSCVGSITCGGVRYSLTCVNKDGGGGTVCRVVPDEGTNFCPAGCTA